ncbi:hypothetical protein Airi02_091250 [Actinoallomurus iriomotensis]|uniref:Uncharacterized protein n=1 Tax=Actinoallomurus iriomotensis TaxID=478107 RepID=A0A9W6SA25_9ACTN|nr:hypothetical protein Airi02_091250 [Actinoallomurus iriomotensis]
MSDPPIADPPVVPPPGLESENTARVPDHQCPDPARDRPVDDGFGGLVLSLADPPPVTGFDLALPGPMLTPPP